MKSRMIADGPRVAAAIVTYNRKDVLSRAIVALAAQSRPLNEIIVIDNASTDGTVAMVAQEFPFVKIVRMLENTGPAGGFAAALDEAVSRGHHWVWVFNDDDEPAVDALEKLLKVIGSLPSRTGMVACGRDNGAGKPYTLGADWKHRQIPVYLTDPNAPPHRIDVVAFSGTLISAALVQDIGVPRSDFFMMIEELEYCLRSREAGWAIYVLPQPLTTALALGSNEQSAPWRGYYQTRNQLVMALARGSLPELWWWALRNAKMCAATLRQGDQRMQRVWLRTLGAWHGLRGVTGRTVTPSSPVL